MFRTIWVVVVLIFGLVLATGSRADEPTLDPGKKYDGELGGEAKPIYGVITDGKVGNPNNFYTIGLHQADLKVKLKAGQAVSIKGTVLGVDRKVQLALRDKTGKVVAGSPLGVKSTILKMKELPSTGNYTVVVGSDQVGAFTVVVSVEEELSEKDLEAKIEALEQELKSLKSKLKEIRSKNP